MSGLGAVLLAAFFGAFGYWSGSGRSDPLESIGFGAVVGAACLAADFAIWCAKHGRKVLGRRP